MPDIIKNESREDFLKRAIPIIMKEGKTLEQATAIASSMYEKHTKNMENAGEPKTDYERLVAHFGKEKADSMIAEIGLEKAIEKLPLRGTKISQMALKDTFQTTKDIFSTGAWNGDEYTEQDLDEMVENFHSMKDSVKVPLKIDLFKKDALKPEFGAGKRHGGMPAVGWITDLKKIGKKLYAHIEHIPKVVKELIDNKAYRQVSSEVTWNFQHNGKRLRRVLTGVAVLGVELPGVTNLDEFAKIYNAKKGEEENPKIYEYEVIKNLKEEEYMDEILVKKYEQQIEDGKSQVVSVEKKYADLLAKSETEKTDAIKKLSEWEMAKQKEEVKLFVEKSIVDGKLLPAHKDTVTLMFENFDPSKVMKFKLNDKEEERSLTKLFQDFISSLPNLIELKPKSEEGEDLKTFALKDTKEFGSEEGQKLDFLVKEYQKTNKDVAYGDALRSVSRIHPELVI